MPERRTRSWVDVALSYAQLGWYVVPFHDASTGKCTCGDARCTRGPHPWTTVPLAEQATSDPEEIRAWSKTAPRGHAGLLVGAASDTVVLEVSGREGGKDALKALEHEHKPLPDVPVMVVDAHRYLRFFTHPGRSIPESTTLDQGLRLRGDGHVLLLPDRTTTAGRSIRRWLIPPTRYSPTLPPEWLRNQAGISHGDGASSETPSIGNARASKSSERPDYEERGDRDAAAPRAPLRAETPAASRTVPADESQRAPADDVLAPSEKTLPFRTYTELDLYKLADPVWYVKPWIAQGGVTVVSGPGKTAGKTTLLLHMMRRLLAEESFLSEPCTKTEVAYVTEQSSSTFSRGLIEADLRDDDTLRRLHVLYNHQIKGAAWPDVMRGCRDFCSDRMVELLVIDSLAPFGEAATLEEDLRRPSFVHPLLKTCRRDIATCIVLPTAQEATGERVLDRLGCLQPHVDTLIHVQPSERGERCRDIHAFSRFKAVPSRLTVRLDGTAYSVHRPMHAMTGEQAQRPARRAPLSSA